MKTKIFCDIADLTLIKKFNKKKIVKGFTTNPSLMRKAGAKDYKHYSKQILKIRCNKLYSFFPTYLYLAIYMAAVIVDKNQKILIINAESMTLKPTFS